MLLDYKFLKEREDEQFLHLQVQSIGPDGMDGHHQIDLLLHINEQAMAWSCKGIKTIYHFRQICCHSAFVCMELLYSHECFKEL